MRQRDRLFLFKKGVRGSTLNVFGTLVFNALFLALCLGWSTHTYAQVTINNTADVDFGSIDFATNYSGNIQLGTDGNISTTGFGIVTANNGNAGAAQITEPNTGILEVKCAQTAQLISAPATPLNIINIEVAINTGVSFNSATSCQGTAIADAVVLMLDMDALNDPTLLFGGEIAIPSLITLPPNKTYTTVGAGTPISLSVVVQ